MGQGFSEVFPPKAKWTPADMPDMTGKVAIVTGGNTGIGKVTCKYLLLNNCTVYLLCRSAQKATEAISELKSLTGKEAHFIPCDLSDLPSIKSAAAAFLSKERTLDVLFNNAGVMCSPKDQLTKQGWDLQFGTNVIGHAYLTLQLLPILLSTAASSPTHSARVVTTSSNAHLGAPKGGIDYATVKAGPVRDKKLGPFNAYWQSKWGNVVFAKELARRYGDSGIISTSLNPGIIRTELARWVGGFMAWLANTIGFDTDPFGATTQLYAGTAPEAASLNGQYLIPWARLATARADTDDEGAGKALWEYVQEQTKDV